MKISRLYFENFRNFKDANEIIFPTDGNVTIIYGTNGDGKTTLHQLFQWVFYGEVHFNKTASNKLYNLKYEHDCKLGEEFKVKGTIDFEHPNKDGKVEYYSLTREMYYKKGLTDSKEINEKFRLLKMVGDDWKVIPDPQKVIEMILPSGLIQYFFFDGESMIADLSQKGHDSARYLRKALYTIFNLNKYEQAVIHIGAQDSSTTVLGKLNASKKADGNNAEYIKIKAQLSQHENAKEAAEKSKNKAIEEYNKNKKIAQDLSEIIGNTKNKDELERKRKAEKNNIKNFDNAIAKERLSFGTDVYNVYPKLFLSKIVKNAQDRIQLKVENEHLIDGVNKTLIDSLLNEKFCICGHEICECEKEQLRRYLRLLPPKSYKSMYDSFKKSSERWSANYDENMLANHIKTILDYEDSIENIRNSIHDIDEDLKNCGSKAEYIQKRYEAEKEMEKWDAKRSNAEKELGREEKFVDQLMKKKNAITDACSVNKDILKKIEIMELVKKQFENKLKNVTVEYSQKLRDAIQFLVDNMLTSERIVEMTPSFELSVKDSFGNEAKSEGQFAVVSFAYIGGIFKLLSDEPILKDKEFPLVLDGPFSKLDVIQRQNVIDTIPSYAPQIILFSKDDLSNCFSKDMSDSTWTLFSNREKNIATVKKGYFPEVFVNNGNYN